MSPQCASELCKLAVGEKDLRDADVGRVHIEQALLDMDDPGMTSTLLVSKAVTDGEIIIPFATDRTIKTLFNELSITLSTPRLSIGDTCSRWNSGPSEITMLRDLSANTEQVNCLFQKTSAERSHIHGQIQNALAIATSPV